MTRGTAIGISLLVLALVGILVGSWALGPAGSPWNAGTPNGWGMMRYGYRGMGMGWAWGGGMTLGLLGMALFWTVVAVAIVLVVRALTPGGAWAGGTSSRPSGPERPLDILQRRYAAGDIDHETYERMKKELGT